MKSIACLVTVCVMCRHAGKDEVLGQVNGSTADRCSELEIDQVCAGFFHSKIIHCSFHCVLVFLWKFCCSIIETWIMSKKNKTVQGSTEWCDKCFGCHLNKLHSMVVK